MDIMAKGCVGVFPGLSATVDNFQIFSITPAAAIVGQKIKKLPGNPFFPESPVRAGGERDSRDAAKPQHRDGANEKCRTRRRGTAQINS